MNIQKMLFATMQQRRLSELMVCYSIRKYVSSYNGYCIRVKRSSDNTTQDIGFVNDVVDVDSILTFVGSGGNGYVIIWYDQSGNGNDLEESTATYPVIMKDGNIVRDYNSIPSIYFYENNLLSKNTSNIGTKISIFCVAIAHSIGISSSPNVVGGHPNRFFQVGLNEEGILVKSMYGDGVNWNQTPTLYPVSNSDDSWQYIQRVVTSINNGNNYLFIDGNYESQYVDSMGNFNDKIRVGGSYYLDGSWVTSHWWKGLISEIIIFKPDILSLRPSIESNILNFYKGTIIGDTSAEFLTITGITDVTIQGAIETLVSDLIDVGIWYKFKAIYPIVGGTADTHKYNLKDPRDSDDAFRLTFQGTVVHSDRGMIGNGSTGYAETHFTPLLNLIPTSIHLSYYSLSGGAVKQYRDFGSYSGGQQTALIISYVNGYLYSQISGNISFANTEFKGLFTASKTQSGKASVYINSTQKANEAASADGLSSHQMYLMATNNAGNLYEPSNRLCAFASIGEGLTSSENADFYDIVEKFQTTLKRSYLPNWDTSAEFLTITGITDVTIQGAIETLVSDLIDAGVWVKMIAIYPFVGGTADTHKYNLKDPRDSDDAFRLTFQGGLTHASTGVLPNGSTGYAETHFIPSLNLIPTNIHLSYYSRTIDATKSQRDFGSYSGGQQTALIISYVNGYLYSQISGNISFANTITQGLFTASKTQSGKASVYINSTQKANEAASADGLSSHQMYLMATNNAGNLYEPSKKECAFASIGEGLTPTEVSDLYTAVQAFQTTLGRQV